MTEFLKRKLNKDFEYHIKQEKNLLIKYTVNKLILD